MTWSIRTSGDGARRGIAVLLAPGLAVVDAPGRCAGAGAAALLLALAARDRLQRPRLSAGPDGVRAAARRRGAPALGAVRVDVRETRRWASGRRLELDTASGPDDEGVLVLLGRRDLGAEPARWPGLRELDPRA